MTRTAADRQGEIALDARRVAAVAATAAGVEIELVDDMQGLQLVSDVVDEIWKPPPGQTTLRVDFMRALTHAGNYCAIVRDGTTPVGVCLGFLSVVPDRELHSHIAGVTPAAQGRHIGRAVKLDQRAWALEHGLNTIGWTYDPLIRRNAFFNIARLGARPTDYLVDFYGSMDDSINAGQPTDRLKVSWRLADRAVVDLATGTRAGGARTTSRSEDLGPALVLGDRNGEPVRRPADPDHPLRLVQVPADIESLRRQAPDLGGRWREEVRDSLLALAADDWRIVDFLRDGFYVFARPEAPPSAPVARQPTAVNGLT